MTNEELQKKFTACDDNLGVMDDQLGQGTERQGVLIVKLAAQPELLALAKEAQKHFSAAHAQLGEASESLKEIHDAVLPSGGGSGDPFTYPEPTEVVPVPMKWGQSMRGYIMDVTKIAGFQFVAEADGTVSLGVASFDSAPTTY